MTVNLRLCKGEDPKQIERLISKLRSRCGMEVARMRAGKEIVLVPVKGRVAVVNYN